MEALKAEVNDSHKVIPIQVFRLKVQCSFTYLIYVCMCVQEYMCVSMHEHAYIFTYMYIYMKMYVDVYAEICIYMHGYLYIYIHIHISFHIFYQILSGSVA